VAVVERMVERCCAAGLHEQAAGVAMEARRLDLLERVLRHSTQQQQQQQQQRRGNGNGDGGTATTSSALAYTLRASQTTAVVQSRRFRSEVLRLLVRLHEDAEEPDWADACTCLTHLGDSAALARVLARLVGAADADGNPVLVAASADTPAADDPAADAGDARVLLAYQIAFDLVDCELQDVCEGVLAALPAAPPPAALAAPAPAAAPAAAADDTAMDADAAAPTAAGNGTTPATAAGTTTTPAPSLPPQVAGRLHRLRGVLSGAAPIALHLEFLYRHNASDLNVLRRIKNSVDARLSVCHSATVTANAYMHAGTSVDAFLRENLEWLARATNWAKFSATAGLGCIHRGQLSSARALMAPYLPRADGGGGGGGSPYSEGGALYALGLITANHGSGTRGFLLGALRGASGPVVQHGACLGLGLAALGTGDEEACEEVKSVLYADDAVAGEAAGLGLGLLCCGGGGGAASADEKAAELLSYARDTQHEKIVRGCAVGAALIAYGREEGADTLIEQMARDQDPILRYGSCFAVGLAYRGTGNNAAVQRLLTTAVSDVSDDVRRAAVLCLGFVLMGTPDASSQVPRLVALLSESFNPHVRYGAAMAVGIACATSGGREALALLDALLSDGTDFVRQGAAIATALVLLQQPEAKVEPFRRRLQRATEDRHEELMARMGAILAAGILDAGGRNATVALRARSGVFRRTAVVGLAVFAQHWYWYPLAHFLPLAFKPSASIGVDSTLRAPKDGLVVRVAARPSLFAYASAATSAEGQKAEVKVEKAVLSTTARAKERARQKKAEKAKKESGDAMEADGPAAAAAAKKEGGAEKKTEGGGEADKKDEKAKAPEPSFFDTPAPCRLVPAAARLATVVAGGRYEPVPRGASATAGASAAAAAAPVGIVVLRDTRAGERPPADAPEYVTAPPPGTVVAAAPAAAAAAAAAPAAEEPAPPAAFEYDDDE
jgi:26S proteasome regulatory subunit N2